jgi:hypothetical protein
MYKLTQLRINIVQLSLLIELSHIVMLERARDQSLYVCPVLILQLFYQVLPLVDIVGSF